MDDDLYARGMAVRREVLGDAHVDAASAASDELDAEFQQLITRLAWGAVWGGDDLDRRTRSLVTIALLAGLGRDELDLHLRAARRIGVSDAELQQVLLHVAVYAGVPAANHAFARAKAIRDEDAA